MSPCALAPLRPQTASQSTALGGALRGIRPFSPFPFRHHVSEANKHQAFVQLISRRLNEPVSSMSVETMACQPREPNELLKTVALYMAAGGTPAGSER